MACLVVCCDEEALDAKRSDVYECKMCLYEKLGYTTAGESGREHAHFKIIFRKCQYLPKRN